MAFNVKVDEDYLTIKLSSHLKNLNPICVKQIADVLMTGNSTITEVVFKSLDGYVYEDSLYVVGDAVTVHTDHLYTYRYDENAMRERGIIDGNSHIRCTVISIDKYNESLRVSYPAINKNEIDIVADWSIEIGQVVKTIGLARPNLDELI
jgi:hypothetical protein